MYLFTLNGVAGVLP